MEVEDGVCVGGETTLVAEAAASLVGIVDGVAGAHAARRHVAMKVVRNLEDTGFSFLKLMRQDNQSSCTKLRLPKCQSKLGN